MKRSAIGFIRRYFFAIQSLNVIQIMYAGEKLEIVLIVGPASVDDFNTKAKTIIEIFY